MAIKGVYFNGRWLTHPGAYSKVDAEEMVRKTGVGGKIIVMLGEARGGKPEEVLWFNNPATAKAILKSGDLLDAMNLAWSPTPEGEGADVIGAMRVNPALQSDYTLKDGNDQDTMKFTSKDYGEDTKYIQVKLENGTATGTKKVSVYDVLTESYESFDNLGEVFTIKYAGDEAYCVITIEASELDGKASVIKTKKGADAGTAVDDIVIDLTSQAYANIGQIINFINSHEGYTCTLVPGVAYSTLSSRLLDIITAVSIKSATAVLITAVRADMAKTITEESALIDCSVINWDSGIPANFAYTALIGGEEGITPSSWETLFSKLDTVELTEVVPITSDASIHAECKAHVNTASNSLRRERRMTCGGASGETIAQVKERIQGLNSSRVQLVYPGVKRYKDGVLVTYPPYVTAGMFAGRHAFKDWGDSCTFDYFDAVGLEKDLTPLEVNELINAGIATLENVQNDGIRLAQDITTCITLDNPLYVERCIAEYADYLNKRIRKRIEQFYIGKGGTKGKVTSIKNAVITILDDEKNNLENIVEYRNVTVSLEERVVKIDYEVAPTEPINFVLLSSHFYTASFEV